MQHELTVLKIMEDGGTTIAGTLISTSNTIQQSLAPLLSLAIGTIPGG